EGKVAAQGRTDIERLMLGELRYRGVGRTPICAITTELPLDNGVCPAAAVEFATTADVYVLRGDLNEEPDATWNADGQGLDCRFAWRRLARQVCADLDEIGEQEIELAARVVKSKQIAELLAAVNAISVRFGRSVSEYVISGSGEFLTRAALEGSANHAHI